MFSRLWLVRCVMLFGVMVLVIRILFMCVVSLCFLVVVWCCSVEIIWLIIWLMFLCWLCR